jgi:putative ABC transport system ATP-binding protein
MADAGDAARQPRLTMTPAIADKSLPAGDIAVARKAAGATADPFTLRGPTVSPKTGVAKAVFQARGITKIYKMGEIEVPALRGIDLDLYSGELVVLLGASGSGKSTLLNILGGLDVPTSGTVRFLDHDLTRATDAELTRYRREHVGFVFQFYNLIPSLTAIENVALVTDIAEHPMQPADALALVGLQDRASHFPAQMSGGEQQRVAIARAIAKRPDVLLCDEPTGALDYETGKLVLNAIDRVNRELGTTTAVITHNVAIAGMADRVVRMTSGRISDDKRNKRRISPEELSW